MTQQNETDHQPAEPEQAAPEPEQSAPEPARPGPGYPSPYLNGGEAIPEAYLAPPQPGQPRFGAPRAQGRRPVGGSQPRYGRPTPTVPPPGGAAGTRRDPALATAWHRLAASTLDWVIIIPASVLAFWSPLSQIWHEVQAVATRYPGLSSPTAQAAIDSISRNPANQRTLVYWILGMFGIALVYYWVQHALWGATVGKRALGVRVVRAADRSAVGVEKAGIRAVAFLAGPAVLMLLVTPVNVIGGALWLADALLLLLSSQSQSLHDRLAGTVVVRQRWLDQQSRGSLP